MAKLTKKTKVNPLNGGVDGAEFEREVFSMLFEPINLLLEDVPTGWLLTIRNRRDIIYVGKLQAYNDTPRPDYLHRFSDMRLSIAVMRRGNRLYEVRALYGRTRAGWSSKPFVRCQREFALEPTLTPR